jgi:hypothetical protein
LQEISPGLVRTEVLTASGVVTSPEEAEEYFNKFDFVLEPRDVSEALVYALSTAPRVQVGSFMTEINYKRGAYNEMLYRNRNWGRSFAIFETFAQEIIQNNQKLIKKGMCCARGGKYLNVIFFIALLLLY